MNIALINASPKSTESASGALLDDLKSLFSAERYTKEFRVNDSSLTETGIEELMSFPVWVFAFPLYVDAIPSHLLSCLRQIERSGIAGKDIHVYAVVNCGFFEGTQNRNALAIMENWCGKSGLTWGMGIGFGGGGALLSIKSVPLGKGPKSTLGKAYAVFADAIESRTAKENIYASIALPRFIYRLAAEIEWRRQIKANGGRVKDLDRRL